MSNWKPAKLGDIAETCLGKMLDKEKNKGEPKPYLANIDVRWGSFDLSNLRTMRFEESETERYGLKNGDLVICEGGEPGRCAIWRDQLPQMMIQKALHRVRANSNFSNEFIFYRLLLAGRRGELDKYFIGSTIKHLTGFTLKQIEFDYPELTEQKKIAAVLSALDAKIELNQRMNEELEGMAKLLYDYWFVQYDFPMSAAYAAALGKPHLTGHPYRASGGKMVYNQTLKREIPEGWQTTTLSTFANITLGQSPPGHSYNQKGAGMVFFQGSTDFGWRYPQVREFTTAPSRLAKQGDILLSVRAPVGTLNVANQNCCIGRGLAALKAKSGHDSFLFEVMLYFKTVFDRRNSSGTTFGAITKDDLHSLEFACPPIGSPLLDAFEEKMKPAHKTILNNHHQNQELTRLRDWLLPMLMNGQVTMG